MQVPSTKARERQSVRVYLKSSLPMLLALVQLYRILAVQLLLLLLLLLAVGVVLSGHNQLPRVVMVVEVVDVAGHGAGGRRRRIQVLRVAPYAAPAGDAALAFEHRVAGNNNE